MGIARAGKEAAKQRSLLPENVMAMNVHACLLSRVKNKKPFIHSGTKSSLRGTTQIVGRDTLSTYLLIAITGLPVIDYFSSPMKSPATLG